MKRFCKLISDYMGVLVLLAAVAAMLWPEVFSHLKPTLISPLLGVIMFGMGLTLRWEDFRVVFSRPRDVMIGCLAQFTVMPLLAFVLARLFRLDEALTVGVVLVGCCPGGTASKVITYLAKGDLALSVGMTGVSTLLAPVVTPLLVWLLAGKTVDVDVMAMFLSILWVVILPIVAGLLVKRLWPRLTEGATAYLPALSSIAIAMIVLIVISASAHKLFAGGYRRSYHRLPHRPPAAACHAQAPCPEHRGGYAELRPGIVVGRLAFRGLSSGHHPGSRLQRMA